MASSRKPRKDEPGAALGDVLAPLRLRDKHVAVGLSGGVDSVVLLHLFGQHARRDGVRLSAIHVHHGLSANANAWARHCRNVCRKWRIPLRVFHVKVRKGGEGLEAAARRMRYEAFRGVDCDVLALAHHLDDQAETVLMSLLRGAGVRGARGMPSSMTFHGKTLLRPLLGTPREAIEAYAHAHALKWIEDESNRDETLTRNFLRRRVGPLLATRFPAWKEALARAARHFARAGGEAEDLLRAFLRSKGLRAPSEAKLVEMVKQLSGRSADLSHDGARLRTYRGKVVISEANEEKPFTPVTWKGEARVALAALGGELRFRRARGKGFVLSKGNPMQIRLRSGGERLQPDSRRPRRTLKNLFQESGVPPWQRERLPLLFCGDALVWAPGLGVDARFQAPAGALGWLPQWHKSPP